MRKRRRGGPARPGLSRTAESNRGESRSDRDERLKMETNRTEQALMDPS